MLHAFSPDVAAAVFKIFAITAATGLTCIFTLGAIGHYPPERRKNNASNR
jgi:hypothetical protein